MTWTYADAAGNTSTQIQNIVITEFVVSASLMDAETIAADVVGDSYQWVDCNNNYTIIAGETSAVFSTMIYGNYAVIVSSGLCKDTSNCIIIDNVGVSEAENIQLSIYPNPSNKGVLFINFDGEIQSIDLIDMLGREISVVTSSDFKKLEVMNLDSGKYFIRIVTDRGVITTDVVLIN